MSYCQHEINAKHLNGKYVNSKHICSKYIDAKKVETKDLTSEKAFFPILAADEAAFQQFAVTGASMFEDVVIKNTLTVPADGLIWSDVAQVMPLPPVVDPIVEQVAPEEEARDVITKEEPIAMMLDFMIPVAAPSNLVGKLRVGQEDDPTILTRGSDTDTNTDTDDDVVVKKCARIRKCLKVKKDAIIKGDLYVEGKIFTKCTPRHHSCSCCDEDMEDGEVKDVVFCQVKCNCPDDYSSSCSSCDSSLSCSSCDSSLSCSSVCDHESELESLRTRLSQLEVLVASFHP